MTEQQRKPVVFIAGPMSGYHDYNRAEFNAEASVMADRGFTVLNPAILPDGLEHPQYLSITLSMLEQADAVFLLDGWEKSNGAMHEFQRARELGLIFMFQSWETAHLAIMHNRYPVKEMACE